MWCLYEAVKTLDAGHELKMIMSTVDADGLKHAVVDAADQHSRHLAPFQELMDAISGIDALSAAATNPKDKALQPCLPPLDPNPNPNPSPNPSLN